MVERVAVSSAPEFPRWFALLQSRTPHCGPCSATFLIAAFSALVVLNPVVKAVSFHSNWAPSSAQFSAVAGHSLRLNKVLAWPVRPPCSLGILPATLFCIAALGTH